MKIPSLPRNDAWLRACLALTRLLITCRIPVFGFGDAGPFATFSSPFRPSHPSAFTTPPARRSSARKSPPNLGAVRPLPPAGTHRRC